MADLVAIAESGRSRYTSLADSAAKLYAPGVHILSALAFVGWYLYTFDLRTALNIAAAVLIITCPCALGLAVPAVTTAASGRLFRAGLLVKHATALERLAEVDTVVFDKTGTLTAGTPEVVNLDELNAQQLSVALALAEGSSHPLAIALTRAAKAARVEAVVLEDLQEVPGYGTQACLSGQIVRLGRAAWVGARGSLEQDSPPGWIWAMACQLQSVLRMPCAPVRRKRFGASRCRYGRDPYLRRYGGGSSRSGRTIGYSELGGRSATR